MKKKRTLVTGQKVLDCGKQTDLTINTKCPKKWAFVDMETGDIWVHRSRYSKSSWKRLDPAYTFVSLDSLALRAIKQIVTSDRYNERYDD